MSLVYPSQSKFSHVSLLLLYIFLLLSYRHRRRLLLPEGLALALLTRAVPIRLSTFSSLFAEGTGAPAFVERLQWRLAEAWASPASS